MSGGEQYSLFDGTPPHQPADTSHAAALAIVPDVKRLQATVLAAIRAAGGLTDEQGIEVTGMAPNTYRPRRCELVLLDLIEKSGERRRTRSGRQAIVWKEKKR